jgi:hypothetical protein
LEEWAAGLDLLILNERSRSTCVRSRGEFIVDLTWASPAAARLVGSWGVKDIETLSDHLYIEMTVRATSREVLTRRLHSSATVPHRKGGPSTKWTQKP